MYYRQHGNAAQAKELHDQGLLGRAELPPLYRALLGYTTLGLGLEPTDAISQPEDKELPDLWITRAELLARRGNHADAHAVFAEAVDRGLPVSSAAWATSPFGCRSTFG